MSDLTSRIFTNAQDSACLKDIAKAIFEAVSDRRSAQIVSPSFHPKTVATRIYFGADADQKPGSFYLIDVKNDNTLEVSGVIRHVEGNSHGQAVAIKPELIDLTGKTLGEIVSLTLREITRVTPETYTKEQGQPHQTPR